MNKTLHELRHIERLTHSLHHILNEELDVAISLDVCCRTVAAGLSLQRDRRILPPGYRLGLPWSTAAALQFLAGRGFFFNPRMALEALTRLEDRHIVDRRRCRVIREEEPVPVGAK